MSSEIQQTVKLKRWDRWENGAVDKNYMMNFGKKQGLNGYQR